MPSTRHRPNVYLRSLLVGLLAVLATEGTEGTYIKSDPRTREAGYSVTPRYAACTVCCIMLYKCLAFREFIMMRLRSFCSLSSLGSYGQLFGKRATSNAPAGKIAVDASSIKDGTASTTTRLIQTIKDEAAPTKRRLIQRTKDEAASTTTQPIQTTKIETASTKTWPIQTTRPYTTVATQSILVDTSPEAIPQSSTSYDITASQSYTESTVVSVPSSVPAEVSRN